MFALSRNLYLQPRVLSQDVALQIAALAKVPNDNRHLFCDCVCGAAQQVWEWDRRANSSQPSRAVIEAAEAARALKTALNGFNESDREWVQKIAAQHIIPASKPDNPLRDLDWTVSVLAQIFNAAIGRSLTSDEAALPRKKGRKRGGFNDKTFRDLVWNLLLSASVSDGKLTLDVNSEKGSLVDALNILRRHVPNGVIPIQLPFGTIQKIKTEYNRSQF